MFQIRAQKECQLCPIQRWLLIICHFDKWIYLEGPSCVIVLLGQHYWSRTKSRSTWQKDELQTNCSSHPILHNDYVYNAENFNTIGFHLIICSTSIFNLLKLSSMCIHNSLLFTVTFLSEQNAAHRRTFLASRSLENTIDFSICLSSWSHTWCVPWWCFLYIVHNKCLIMWRHWEVSKSSICLCHHTPILGRRVGLIVLYGIIDESVKTYFCFAAQFISLLRTLSTNHSKVLQNRLDGLATHH